MIGALILLATSAASAAQFSGAASCAVCHAQIFRSQSATPMATTWRNPATPLLQLTPRAAAENSNAGWNFQLSHSGAGLDVSVHNPSEGSVAIPVRIVMGGERHGLSFLAELDSLGGIPLERPATVEARYAWSATQHKLVLSPGFPEEEPRTLDTALGIALNPTLEKRCVTCHGQPVADPSASGASGGVHCESCHGPGSEHLLAVGRGRPHEGIVNPARLDADGKMAVCANCHTGFSRQSDPLPDELLVSNQVNALSNAECYIQSGKAVGCTSCHDPHVGSAGVSAVSVKACLGCHQAAGDRHAAVCPVNASAGCIGCHMPSIQKGSFHMVDHWIRVHPEQNVKVDPSHGVASRVRPLREFLRVISTAGQDSALAAKARVDRGESFFQVAHELSSDSTAPIGGYLGPMWLAQLDQRIADSAAALGYGQTSAPIDMGDHWIVAQRLPRDFKLDAARLHNEASALRAGGDLKGALEKYQQALIIYPNFLRSLIGMGATFAQSGNVANGAGVLDYAVRTYPDDAEAEFNFGIALGGLGQHDRELSAYRQAIELDPGLDAAYENLGAALSTAGDAAGAIAAFRQGLQVDPLSANLYYDLSLVLAQSGDRDGATRARTLAVKIDPSLASRPAN